MQKKNKEDKRIETVRRKESILQYYKLARKRLCGLRSEIIYQAIAKIHFVDVATVSRILGEYVSNQEVADGLVISEDTLRTYVNFILQQIEE